MLGYLVANGNLTHETGLLFEDFNTGDNSSITVLYNDTDIHALPIYFTQTLAALLSPSASDPILVSSHPWPYSAGITWNSNVFTTVLLIGMALTIPPGGFAIDIVRDRKLRMKQQLYVAGVSVFQYWCAQFVTYIISFILPIAVAIILAFATHVSALTGLLNLSCCWYIHMHRA